GTPRDTHGDIVCGNKRVSLLRLIRLHKRRGRCENIPQLVDIAFAALVPIPEEPRALIVQYRNPLKRSRRLLLDFHQLRKRSCNIVPVRVRHRPIEHAHRGEWTDILKWPSLAVWITIIEIYPQSGKVTGN